MATDGLRRLSVANLAMRYVQIPLPTGTKQAKTWRENLPFPPHFQPFYASKFSRFIAWLNASSPLRGWVEYIADTGPRAKPLPASAKSAGYASMTAMRGPRSNTKSISARVRSRDRLAAVRSAGTSFHVGSRPRAALASGAPPTRISWPA